DSEDGLDSHERSASARAAEEIVNLALGQLQRETVSFMLDASPGRQEEQLQAARFGFIGAKRLVSILTAWANEPERTDALERFVRELEGTK
ncbi:MAG: hypothetical protein HC927_07055, partial [Deltaproteobacteria bacterium]|nr:hypothetical protein [Deltaproteobacteria bacterium]